MVERVPIAPLGERLSTFGPDTIRRSNSRNTDGWDAVERVLTQAGGRKSAAICFFLGRLLTSRLGV